MQVDINRVYKQIADFAKEFNVKKVVLFGSRARGDNKPKSDIDIAVYGCINFDDFKFKIDEELWSLLHVDIINMDSKYVSDELIEEINRDGRILYEDNSNDLSGSPREIIKSKSY